MNHRYIWLNHRFINLVKSLKFPTSTFNIYNYVTFNTSTTRSGTFNKLIHNFVPTNQTRHFYFNRTVRLWNSLPAIDLNLTTNTIKSILYSHFWTHFHQHFDTSNVHTFHYLCPCNQCSHDVKSFSMLTLLTYLQICMVPCSSCRLPLAVSYYIDHYYSTSVP